MEHSSDISVGNKTRSAWERHVSELGRRKTLNDLQNNDVNFYLKSFKIVLSQQ